MTDCGPWEEPCDNYIACTSEAYREGEQNAINEIICLFKKSWNMAQDAHMQQYIDWYDILLKCAEEMK